MTQLLVGPILVPLAGAVALFAVRGRPTLQRWLAAAASLVYLIWGGCLLAVLVRKGYLALQIGDWPAPYGITLVADVLSGVMVTVTGFVGFGVMLFSAAEFKDRDDAGVFYPLYQLLLCGVTGAFLTGDLFNLYVWFEVMLMASFVMLTLGGGRAQLGGAVKYVAMNLLSSMVFLSGLGILYGKTGTLNLADLMGKLAGGGAAQTVLTSAMLFLVAFGIKAALFPLFFWLPASYPTPPAAVSAIFAGLLTKVGVYALLRTFTLVFMQDRPFTSGIILGLSLLTMVAGVLGAASQFEFRRILSFHIISQIGYMTLGLALGTEAALAAAVFYIVHHIIVKTNLFLISGTVARGEGSYALEELGGLYRRRPALAVLFLIPAFSLAGLPPLSGFFAKFAILKAALDQRAYVAAATALAVGLLTLFSMTKIWSEAFWKERARKEPEKAPGTLPFLMTVPIALMAAATVIMGLLPEVFFRIARLAAGQLLDPSGYIRAVMER